MSDDELDLDLDESADETHTSTWMFVGAIIAAVVLGFGTIGYLSGSGWFGYRQVLYGNGRIYLGNYTTEDRLVSIDGRAAVAVDAERWEVVDLVGGTSTIRVMNTDRETLSTHTVTTEGSDAYFKVAGAPCLVASDVGSYFGEGPESPELEIVETIEPDQRLYVPESNTVFWPGHDLPNQLTRSGGPPIWIEKIGCRLLEDPEVMRQYLGVRLKERMGQDERETGGPKNLKQRFESK